jgi:hypothetical protein
MGIDAGFDMVPRLAKDAVDRHNWATFIGFIQEHYKDDDQVETKPNYILFKAGEHPMLPFEGHKFLRFSSKITGRIASESRVEYYIHTVIRIAKIHFGSHVRCWMEVGHYNWSDVNDSIKSYKQVREPIHFHPSVEPYILTTHEKPDELEMPTSVARFAPGIDLAKESDVPLFEVRQIPGRGKGVVARFDLATGTRILVEKPLLTIQRLRAMPAEIFEKSLASKLKSLTKISNGNSFRCAITSLENIRSVELSRQTLCHAELAQLPAVFTPAFVASTIAVCKTRIMPGTPKPATRPSTRFGRSRREKRSPFRMLTGVLPKIDWQNWPRHLALNATASSARSPPRNVMQAMCDVYRYRISMMPLPIRSR